MAIEIRETFQLAAPIERVWRFLLDPQQVVTCMPGAALDQVIDERTFLGTIRVKVGPVVSSYQGRVQFVRVDEAVHSIDMVAEGGETSGSGNARATMTSRLTRLPGGGTEVVTEAHAEITGRVMQFGQGMINGVSHELFKDFVARTRERMDAAEPAAAAERSSEPVRIVPVLVRTLWSALSSLLRRIFRRGGSTAAA